MITFWFHPVADVDDDVDLDDVFVDVVSDVKDNQN